jgi:hypothetical protein
MQLRYFVPFKAQEGVDAQFALREKLINIEGLAVDTSVNKNRWQVPEEDLDFFTETLKDVQLRADHAESVFMIVGKVPLAKRQGQEVFFRAEVGGEEKLIDKIVRGYVKYVSVQVDSDDVQCSTCHKPTRNEGMLVHLCPDAWEIVHKPRVRELSIVASPAYEKTEFKPVGFAAAMNENQTKSLVMCEGACVEGTCTNRGSLTCRLNSQLLNGNKYVGSRREPQEPEKQQPNTKEVKPMSEQQNAQQKASPHQAQGIVNVAPGEGAPKELTYQQYIDQLTQLKQQIMQKPGASDAELNDLQNKIADLEGELAKRAKRAELGKKISELSKKVSEADGEDAEEGGDGTKQDQGDADGAGSGAEARRTSGKGIVGAIEGSSNPDSLGDYKWFNDLIKASRKLANAGFKG